MPLVKRYQANYGKDKLEVLMLSVDLDYGTPLKEAIAGNRKVLKQQGVDWPNVLLPKGWDDAQKLFNLDGYSLSLGGADGIVLGVDLMPEDVNKWLAKALKRR
jgi:hypothetical protein